MQKKTFHTIFGSVVLAVMALGWALHEGGLTQAVARQESAPPGLGRHICKLVRVRDGDSFLVRCPVQGKHRRVEVRLGAIDAPELNQPWGPRARQELERILGKKSLDMDCYKKDASGRREVCRVRVMQGDVPRPQRDVDVQLAMLQAGAAWWYKWYAQEQTDEERQSYSQAEQKARREGRGLWRDARAVPPWEWRRKNRAS